jgi:hypothetical protein
MGYVGSPLPGATRYKKASRTRLINLTDDSLGAVGYIRSIHRGEGPLPTRISGSTPATAGLSESLFNQDATYT